MAVVSDPVGRVSRMVNQNLLGDEVQSARCHEPLVIKRSVVAPELHQVDRCKVASRVVKEHVFRAGIAGVDTTAVGACVPLVDRRVVLNSWISTMPSAIGHSVEDLSGSVLGRLFLALVGNPSGAPNLIVTNRLHELVGQTDRQIRILEHHR